MNTKQEQTNDDIKEVVVEISACEGVRGGAQHVDLEAFFFFFLFDLALHQGPGVRLFVSFFLFFSLFKIWVCFFFVWGNVSVFSRFFSFFQQGVKRLYPPLYRLACNIKDEKVPISIQVTALVGFSFSANFLPFKVLDLSCRSNFPRGSGHETDSRFDIFKPIIVFFVC